MSEAKKCDMCSNLYEVDKDDNKVTVQEASYNANKPKIIGFLKLFNAHVCDDRGSSLMDHCQSCTEKAIRRFMAKFDIKELKGNSFVCTVNDNNGDIYFADDKTIGTLFPIGKRVRITVEVL